MKRYFVLCTCRGWIVLWGAPGFSPGPHLSFPGKHAFPPEHDSVGAGAARCAAPARSFAVREGDPPRPRDFTIRLKSLMDSVARPISSSSTRKRHRHLRNVSSGMGERIRDRQNEGVQRRELGLSRSVTCTTSHGLRKT